MTTLTLDQVKKAWRLQRDMWNRERDGNAFTIEILHDIVPLSYSPTPIDALSSMFEYHATLVFENCGYWHQREFYDWYNVIWQGNIIDIVWREQLPPRRNSLGRRY